MHQLPEPLLDVVRLILRPRQQARYLRDWWCFRRETKWLAQALRSRTITWRGEVLIHSVHGYIPSLKEELLFGAVLAWHGYRPVFLISRNASYERYIKLFGTFKIVYWNDHCKAPDKADRQTARELITSARDLEGLVALEHAGVAVGRHALSWAMRILRSGSLSMEQHGAVLAEHIAQSLCAARAARSVLAQENAAAILMNERGYTPFGEFFDMAIEQQRRIVQFVASHQDDARVFKAYSLNTRTDHPYSLSPVSWQQALQASFGEAEVRLLMEHWEGCYASRTWFNFQRLQHLTRLQTPEEISGQLNLDTTKKTAIVFSHIFWDATFFYGDNLYLDYQRWFVETVRLANRNRAVNWIIKLHPVNVWRLEADGAVNERYAEIVALEQAGITLESHVQLLLPETDISTWSLFQVGDYCVTVRGTVGVEMAALGKRVVTAGSGHYSDRGFTTGATSIAEYERCLLDIQDLPPASAEERERALRYAYWLLWKKPFRFGTFKMEYSSERDIYHPLNGQPRFATETAEEFFEAPAPAYWAHWMAQGDLADCILDGGLQPSVQPQARTEVLPT